MRILLVTAGTLFSIASPCTASVTSHNHMRIAFSLLKVVIAKCSKLIIRDKTLDFRKEIIGNITIHHHFRQIIPEFGEHMTILVIETLYNCRVHVGSFMREFVFVPKKPDTFQFFENIAPVLSGNIA
jgi:hypothetical protein